MTPVAVDSAHLRRLGEETFGQKLARARVQSKVGLRGAAALLGDVVGVSYASLSRLEDLTEPPPARDVRKRTLATLAVMAYGYDPEDFGLSLDDLPRSFDVTDFVERAEAARGVRIRSRCSSSAA